jgi:hypothetical protein
MMRRVLAISLVALSLSVVLRSAEGMFPLSELPRLDLKSKGLSLSSTELYNPGGSSLVEAIVSLGGCTGSFVSPDGLVLTNHHCAFGAVQAASSADHDYVTAGFRAATRTEEVPARGATVRITQSYRDVSKEVLAAVAGVTDPGERTKAIDRASKAIVAQAEKAAPGTRAEVAEMFAGKTYVLFVYASFRDVRLVYVPPRAIGEFGGEQDNWMWPRHTGDFSFLRVYVAPDGKAADYAAGNVPYRPRRFLRVQPKGVDENDLVFILGYPGRTFRHRTSHYLAYEQAWTLPQVADEYSWQIETMERIGKRDRATALKFDARIKGLANTMKNYRGKLQGLRRLDLVATKRAEELTLQSFIDADPARKARFGTLLADIGAVYDDMATSAPRAFALRFLPQTTLVATATSIWAAAAERVKPDLERLAPYMERNVTQTREDVARRTRDFDAEADRAVLAHALERTSSLPPSDRIPGLDALVAAQGGLAAFLDRLYAVPAVTDAATVRELFGQSTDALAGRNDPALALGRVIYEAQQAARPENERREGALSRLMGDYLEVKALAAKSAFVPDANGTLRFTYGHVRGYRPADALAATPITTLAGVLEKAASGGPYETTPALVEQARDRARGPFVHPRLKDVPVAILYDTDTTGGNSGSPVLNAKGELIGLNFDRAWEATINDYAWSPSYSRSIGVDIRYVLWVTDRVGGAGALLKEMGVR